MDFRILGNLEVAVGSRLVSAGGPREQVVLGVLLLDVGRLDTWMFETKAAEAQRAASAGRLSDAAGALREALRLRRGRLLEGLAGRVIESAAANWEERRRSAEDAYYEYMLRLGRHRDIVAELGCLVGGDPLRGITAAQLMLALYRSGDQAAALQAYQTTGDRLREDLGVDPGPELRRLRHQILSHETALQWQGSPAGQAPASRASAWRVVPRQLPGAVRHFTGRDRELKALTDLLSQADESPGAVVISAIDGTAGVGKTALALYWAHQVAEHFPDGQLYVNLRGFDPAGPPVATADALHGFFDAFEVPQRGYRNPSKRRSACTAA